MARAYIYSRINPHAPDARVHGSGVFLFFTPRSPEISSVPLPRKPAGSDTESGDSRPRVSLADRLAGSIFAVSSSSSRSTSRPQLAQSLPPCVVAPQPEQTFLG